MHILINHNELQPQTNYTVDVQATYCPEYFLQGPWSEWSSTANWKTEALNVKGSLNVQSSINIEGGSLSEFIWKCFMRLGSACVFMHTLQ